MVHSCPWQGLIPHTNGDQQEKASTVGPFSPSQHLIDRHQEEEETFDGGADDHLLEEQEQIQYGKDEYVLIMI